MSRSRNAVSTKFAVLVMLGVICGTNAKAPSRVQQGQTVKEGEFPGVVLLTTPGGVVATCGGALIGPRHVLTAGHCINRGSDRIMIRAGIRDIRNFALERMVDQVIVHPDYVEQTEYEAVQNDIAIVVLKEALPVMRLIQPLMLPTRPPLSGANYTFAGWGRNKPPQEEAEFQFELQSLVMKLDPDICRDELPLRFCAYSNTGATCSGDSGSPLIRAGRVYGIDSASNCKITEPSYFVNVYYYTSWIKDVMSNT